MGKITQTRLTDKSIIVSNSAFKDFSVTYTDISEWSLELVADRFEEAISTTRKLPPVTVQGYFNSWPDIKHTPSELMLMEARPMRVRATPDAISRLEEVLGWMIWLEVFERKIVWRRAAKIKWKTICYEFNVSESTASRIWKRALKKIVIQLK